MRDPAVMDSIRGIQRTEREPNRYYWDDVDGVRYAHYYGYGAHRYGFYHGPHFYWTRWYGNN